MGKQAGRKFSRSSRGRNTIKARAKPVSKEKKRPARTNVARGLLSSKGEKHGKGGKQAKSGLGKGGDVGKEQTVRKGAQNPREGPKEKRKNTPTSGKGVTRM